MPTIRPLGTYLLLRYLPETTPPGLIQRVTSSSPAARKAVIEAVGPDVLDHQPGQTVVVSTLVGVTLGDGQVLAEETAVLADV